MTCRRPRTCENCDAWGSCGFTIGQGTLLARHSRPSEDHHHDGLPHRRSARRSRPGPAPLVHRCARARHPAGRDRARGRRLGQGVRRVRRDGHQPDPRGQRGRRTDVVPRELVQHPRLRPHREGRLQEGVRQRRAPHEVGRAADQEPSRRRRGAAGVPAAAVRQVGQEGLVPVRHLPRLHRHGRLPAQLDRLAQGQVPPGQHLVDQAARTSTARCSACPWSCSSRCRPASRSTS